MFPPERTNNRELTEADTSKFQRWDLRKLSYDGTEKSKNQVAVSQSEENKKNPTRHTTAYTSNCPLVKPIWGIMGRYSSAFP